MHDGALAGLPLLLVQMLLILVVGRVATRASRRLGQPGVIAEIAAGIVLGPSLLGALFPHLAALVFPASGMPALALVGQVGLVLFMFLIGLEFDTSLLRGRGATPLVISQAGIGFTWLLSAGLSLWLYPRHAPEGVPLHSFALFMAVAMSITAFPVLARILAERRLTRTPVGALALATASVDDVTAWCVLAVVVSVVRAEGLANAAVTTVLALGFIALMMLVVRPFLQRVSRLAGHGVNANVVAACLMLVFGSALITELIGIHALFGAFLAGAVMPRRGGLSDAIAHKMEDLVTVGLLPLFFATSGLRTQLGLLEGPAEWGTAALIIAVASLGKFGGATLATRLTGADWRSAATVGVLLNTRGLMELIVLNIGLDLGVLSPRLFAMMVVMALFTTVLTTPVLARLAPREEAPSVVPDETQPRVIHGWRVLMCASDPAIAPAMTTVAAGLVRAREPEERPEGTAPVPDGALVALQLVDPDRPSVYLRGGAAPVPTEAAPSADDPTPDALQALMRAASQRGCPARPLTFPSDDPATAIAQTAGAIGADLVLLGVHRPLFSRSALGGVVADVLDQTDAAVGLLVDHGLTRLRRVLVTLDAQRADGGACEVGLRLAASGVAAVEFLEIGRPGVEGAPHPGLPPGASLRRVDHDDPPAALIAASRGYDLVVLEVGEVWDLSAKPDVFHRERLVDAVPASLLAVRGRRDA
jgi:Kef-type K+ transport system membrane component KefB/nucleotide-binding universal stress UspA family protein